MEAKTADVTDRPLTRALCTWTSHPLGGILDNEQIILIRQRHDDIHFHNDASVVYRHDSAGFISNRRPLNQRFVNI